MVKRLINWVLAVIVLSLWIQIVQAETVRAGAEISNKFPETVGHAEEVQGSPWVFPMDEVIKDLKKRCSLKPEKGPCKAICRKYYFDPETRKCREFVWGGCDGVVPFEAEKDCRELCE